MTKRNAGVVAIRLDLRGQEELKRQLAELGPAGERLSRDLQRAMKPLDQQGALVKRIMGEASDAVDDLARSAGPLGSAFVGLNPVLLGVGAVLGGLVLGVREMFVLMERSRETASWARGMETVADTTGFAADRVLEFRTAFELMEQDIGGADMALEEFSKRLGEFRATGQGEARDGLEALGLGGASLDALPVEEALDRVLERLADIEDPSRRLALADKLGLRDAAPLLQQSRDEIERILGAAEDINRAFSDGALADLAEASRQIAEAQSRARAAQRIQATVTMPLEVARQRTIAEFEEQKASLLLSRIPLEERTTEQLELQARHTERMMAAQRVSTGENPYATAGDLVALQGLEDRLTGINDELERREALLERSAQRAGMADYWDNRLGGDDRQGDAPAPALSLERRRELEALLTQQLTAIQTPLQRVTALEADLNAARAAYLRTGEESLRITEAEIAAILEHTRAQLGLNEVKLPDKARPGQGGNGSGALSALEQTVKLERARAEGNASLVAALEAQANLAARIRQYEEAGVKTAEARQRAEADMAELAGARERTAFAELEALREAHELTIARLRGDEARVAELERQARIEADIARMTAQGMADATARDVAESRARDHDQAARVGNFRNSVNDGFAAGFDSMRQHGGDFDDFIQGMGLSFAESALERLTTGLADMATDFLFDQASAAVAGSAQGAAAGVPMATAITGAGATAATSMATAIAGAGSAVAAQIAAAVAGANTAGAAALALPGLDSGGSLFIGGAPGIDNNILSINNRPVARVSADERIDITPRLGGGQRGGNVVNQYFSFNASGFLMRPEDLMDEVDRRAGQAAGAAFQAAEAMSEARAQKRARSSRYQLARP